MPTKRQILRSHADTKRLSDLIDTAWNIYDRVDSEESADAAEKTVDRLCQERGISRERFNAEWNRREEAEWDAAYGPITK